MEYRELGPGIEVSCLALGGGVFGRDCGKEETFAVIHAASDLGVNFIDTADVYSRGLSEEWIGAAVRNNPRRWVIATKAGVAGGEPRGKTGRRDTILKRAEESLRRLRIDAIDLYQMHHFDPETPLEETLEALDLLVKQGKARLVGASNYSGAELRSSLQVARSRGLVPFASTQVQYNLLKRECENDQLPVSAAEGVHVLVYGALGRGVLTGKYNSAEGIPPDSRAFSSAAIRSDLAPEVMKAVEGVAAFARERNRAIGGLALAWALRRREVASLIMGVRSAEQLKANTAAVSWRLSESELKAIDETLGDIERYRSFFSYGG